MSADAHTFAASEWPFNDPTDVAAISTRRVIEEGYPILLVTHDEDGATLAVRSHEGGAETYSL